MRYEDWPKRLNRIISECQEKKFQWGKHDCCLFAANVILELTGIDYAAELRGSYHSAKNAQRVLKGLSGVRGIAGSALGEEISPKLAQRGDIVLVESEGQGETLAVCVGNYCVAPGLEKLERKAMSSALAAWRVV